MFVSEEIDIVRQMEEDISNAEKKPTVMVAMPAYNEERRIAETVSGVKPYADVVVVVDDGSRIKQLPLPRRKEQWFSATR